MVKIDKTNLPEKFTNLRGIYKFWYTEFLQELNDTGSFPDESEKTPMCFVKCYFESVGVMTKEGEIDNDITISNYQLQNDDIVDDCRKELSEYFHSSSSETETNRICGYSFR